DPPASRRGKGRRDHRAVRDQDADRGAPARALEPLGLRFLRRGADEDLARLLARGLVGLAGSERARDVVLASAGMMLVTRSSRSSMPS
ncbi:MAG: hypothetical protein DME03_07765, partial [Candidatus Rokuibacteriota bacterium]